jgi:hypothetical protein
LRLKTILILVVILLGLGGYFYWSNIPQLPPKAEPQLFVWMIDMEELERIDIRLPAEDKSQAFIKAEDRFWHFDDAQKSQVDMERWGGIPLLLEGPGVLRVLTENTTAEKLAEFGLTQPRMKIILTLENGNTRNITIGSRTPDGNAFYIQAPGSNAVAIVDYAWYAVLERLIKEPPYVLPTNN